MESKQRIADTPKPILLDAFGKEDTTSIYWLGNGGALINSRGTIILIDPLLKGFDMKLLVPPPLLPEDVPHCDGVLITHCDNDHMSRQTCKELVNVCSFFAGPKYVASLLNEEGIPAKGYDIHSSFSIGSVTVTLTPADHAWQNESPKHATRHFAMEDYCGFRIDTLDGSIWMPGDSRLMEEQLHQDKLVLILMDISDSRWHIGLEGVQRLTTAYPDATLIPIHWGCVDAPEWKEFNGNPEVVKQMIVNPDRMKVLAPGEQYILQKKEL